MVKIGQEPHWTQPKLFESYWYAVARFRGSLTKCLEHATHAHTEACALREALKHTSWTPSHREALEAAEIDMVRLETLRRQIQTTLGALDMA